MGYLLKEALKNLCGANQWSYAVFWKIGCQNPELLIWEECFSEPVSHAHLLGISRIEEPGIGFDGYNACGFSAEFQAGDSLHLLINKMMTDNHVSVVGEGLVGRAAITGNHQWILPEDCTREAHSPEVLRELCQQFSAGMQTVAVIPVLPHGVVQLGSFFAMAENIRFVNDVKTLVLQPGHEPGLLVSENYAAKEFPLKIGIPAFLGNSTSGDLSGILNMINSTPFIAENCNYLENSAQTTQFVGETSGSLARQIQDNSQSNGAAFNASSSGQSHIKLYDDLEAKFAMSMKSNSTLTNELVAKVELISLHPDILMNQQPSLHFPRSYQLSSSSSSTIDSGSLRWLEKGLLSNAGIQGHFGTPNVSSGMLTSVPRTNIDMISSSHEDPGDHLTTNHMLVYNSGSGHYFTDDRNAMHELNVCNERIANKIIQAHGVPLSKHDEHKNSGELPPGFVLADRNHEFEGYSKKPDEMSKTNRKRLKPGEKPRSRPKDRQMIQDRVKELREIVPNGAKCSIDALLERTIKHMLFLQSVTKHADKLKQTGESKINSKGGDLLSKDNHERGATWAYEVGSQSMVCPIIVEDLNQPRQMLVEMLCEERGLFLEIADIIRGLGLTILKGVMETGNDKIWAHFAVEANRDVTRMEIFVSLVHLLEKNAKGDIQPAKGIGKNIP